MNPDLLSLIQNDNVQTAGVAAASGVVGWIVKWWSGRERYQAHVTFDYLNTMQGPQELPVIVIQSIHNEPINVTRVRIRDGFGRIVDMYPYYSEDPDYPSLPKTIAPQSQIRFALNDDALKQALDQSKWLNWLWVPRAYVCVETMGRGERRFQAEGGIPWPQRRKRYRR